MLSTLRRHAAPCARSDCPHRQHTRNVGEETRYTGDDYQKGIDVSSTTSTQNTLYLFQALLQTAAGRSA